MPQTPNNLALDVLITGSEFHSDENRAAFVRIAEAIEQFSAHTREPIVLVRQPTDLNRDHFAILWTHGLALAAFYNQAGVIHGKATGPWRTEPSDAVFTNPFEELSPAAKEVASSLRNSHLPISVVAIFNGSVREVDVETSGSDIPGHAMTLEYGIARSLIHMPNLLRTIDHKVSVISLPDLEQLATQLDRSNQSQSILRSPNANLTEETSSVTSLVRPRSKLWLIPLAAIVIGIIIYTIVVSSGPSKVALRDTVSTVNPAVPKSDGPSQIVIELPKEVQLLVSPKLYESRLALDQALAHAEGQRYLPATEQVIVYDSLTLAKGVYGYFKVDNAWRKGKLLQTFQRNDTIHIDNFLGPLP